MKTQFTTITLIGSKSSHYEKHIEKIRMKKAQGQVCLKKRETIKNAENCQMWWWKPVVPALDTVRQEDHCESRPTWAT